MTDETDAPGEPDSVGEPEVDDTAETAHDGDVEQVAYGVLVGHVGRDGIKEQVWALSP